MFKCFVIAFGGVLLGLLAAALDVRIFIAVALYSIGFIQMMILGALK